VSGPTSRIVVVEDDPVLLDQLTWALKAHYVVLAARDAVQGRELCASSPDLYLFDLRLPPSGKVEEGLELLRQVKDRDPDATVVMMSGEGERRDALTAIEMGAFDFFQKPIDASELLIILNRALERRRLVAENLALRRQAEARSGAERLVGESAAMRALVRAIEKVAPSDATVLIEGESGTGKELVAESIHALSPRRSGPFVPVNITALPDTLVEAELFGHEKGAFTGAVGARPGRFELANGGSLFLDEIGTLPASIQAKLLRVLETRQVERLGGRRAVPIDFRLISATNEDLEARAAAGAFRQDLLYRLNTIPIHVPALRERLEDLPLLAGHFLEKYGTRHHKPGKRLSEPALARLRAHRWTGNVRELEHVIEMMVLFSEGDVIGEEDLPRLLRANAPPAVGAASFGEAVAAFERKLLEGAIADAGGVKARAARRLGLDENQIKYLCRKYGL
jgi:DNA-binding NtrC family response regulator